jgi:2-iminobutanoate/2-iminopropanoate deaminase
MNHKLSIAVFLLPLVIFFSLPGPAGAQEKPSTRTVIALTDGPSTSPFSPALLVGDTLYISGQLGLNPQGKPEEETTAVQAERILKTIEALCKKAGMTLSNVVETTVFIMDFADFGEFNTIYRKYFPENPPTRATVQVAKLAANAKIEISAVAVK